MSIKRFNEVFGIEADPEEEKRRFVHRINQTILTSIQRQPYPDDYERVFRFVCYQMGINADDLVSEANSFNYGSSRIIPRLR